MIQQNAQSVQSGYLPNVDVVLAQHTGSALIMLP